MSLFLHFWCRVLTRRSSPLWLIPVALLATSRPAFCQEPAVGNAYPKLNLKTDWPWWRGPTLDGVAVAGQEPTLKWSDDEHIVWKTPLVGRGHGSPTIVGDDVLLVTADPNQEVQALECFDRESGKPKWKTVVHTGKFIDRENAKSSHASISPACDGERIFVSFVNDGAVHATALTRGGKKIWSKKICDFVNHQGYAASPLLWGPLVIVVGDNKGGGAVAGLDRKTGETVWRIERPSKPNYVSPAILKLDGRDQLVLIGCDLVGGFDPLTGKTLWEAEGATTECVISPVGDGERVFTGGGYPKNHVSAVRAGSGKTEWENTSRVYVPSMICRDGWLFANLDAGVVACWKSATGEEAWKGRLNGTFSSSLVLVDDHLLATNEAGRTFVFKASPKAFELVGENQLGDEAFATPVVCGGRIYHRFAKTVDGKRQEFLACIGE